MALPQTDAFTRADGNTVGGNWTELEPAAANSGINTNRLFIGATTGSTASLVYQADGGDNMYVQTTYEGRHVAAAFVTGIFIRGAVEDAGAGVYKVSGYALVVNRANDWDVGTNDILLCSLVDCPVTDATNPPTGCTVLDGYTSPGWALGDTLKLTMTGTTVQGWYKGAKVVEATGQSSFSGNVQYGYAHWQDVVITYWDNFAADITATAPVLSLPTSADITPTTATLGATVDSDGGDTITERGIVWALTANPTTSDTKVTTSGTTGLFTVAVTNLKRNKTIHYRGFATNSLGTTYTDDDSFSTKKGGSGTVIVGGGGSGRDGAWSPAGIRPKMYGT